MAGGFGSKQDRNRWKAKVRQAVFAHMPLWISRGRAGKNKSVRDVLVEEVEIPLPHLPAGLDGLTVTHLSDLHLGPLYPIGNLPGLVAGVNRLKSDLIVLTGDMVDLHLNVLPELTHAILQLRAKLGVWMVLGNHDHLENVHELLKQLRAAGLQVLVNESAVVEHHHSRILIAGIDFASRKSRLSRLVHETLTDARRHGKTDFRLLLSHHPDAFDHAVQHRVSLTLAGHTHGGQVVLAKTNGKRGSIGLGSLRFRYPHGLYRKGEHYLYVTTGVGSLFPLRVQCPAQIARLTLRRVKTTG